MRILNRVIYQYKSVAWLVLAAVLALAVIPVHLHCHHLDDGASELYEIDLHVEAGSADHQHHDDTHILKASPDALAKKYDGAAKILFPLALLFLLLPVIHTRHATWRYATPVRSSRSYYHLIPHLRAPPRC